MWLLRSLLPLLKPLLLLAYCAWVGGLRVRRCQGQWRAVLQKPGALLGMLFVCALLEWAITHFSTHP